MKRSGRQHAPPSRAGNLFAAPRTRCFLCALLLLCATAQSSDVFTSSGYARGGAEYLRLPVYAHYAGLCGAVGAWRQDLAGAQFNPAILEASPPGALHAGGSYGILSNQTNLYGIDAVSDIGNIVVGGLTLMGYGIEGFDGRDSFGFPTGSFNYAANTLSATVAGGLKWSIAAGMRVRYLHERLDNGSANGIGFDAGLTWRPWDFACLGLSVLNVASKLWWSTGHADPILPAVRLGINGMFLDSSLTAEVDIDKSDWQPFGVRAGVEYKLLRMIPLRAGIGTEMDATSQSVNSRPDFSAGIGFRYQHCGVDYAFVFPEQSIDLSSHRISAFVLLPHFWWQ